MGSTRRTNSDWFVGRENMTHERNVLFLLQFFGDSFVLNSSFIGIKFQSVSRLLPPYREISAQKHKKFLHLPLDDVGYDPI